jgi:hypothetical protein
VRLILLRVIYKLKLFFLSHFFLEHNLNILPKLTRSVLKYREQLTNYLKRENERLEQIER